MEMTLNQQIALTYGGIAAFVAVMLVMEQKGYSIHPRLYWSLVWLAVAVSVAVGIFT